MAKFVKKPVIVEAFQLTYEMALGREPVPKWFSIATKNEKVKVFVTEKIQDSQYCIIYTSSGTAVANARDYIVKGLYNTIFTCSPEVFEATYEAVEE